jgi:hypothetical protein
VIPLVPSALIQWTLFTEISCSTIVRACFATALVVAHDELDGHATEPGKPLPGPSGTWMSA